MRVAVVTFPGSNCDDDCAHAFGAVLPHTVLRVWHKEQSLPERTDLVVLPGGFSYGDYLRTGAMARLSPIMTAVAAHARRGGLVLGICNGFQILCEAGLLPGALLRNNGLSFVCQPVPLRVETDQSPLTRHATPGEVLTLPIAHGEGNYYIDDEGLRRLESEDLVLLRYTNPRGEVTAASNPNGSRAAIAGIQSPSRRVMGLMPHPERAAESAIGNTEGLVLLEGLCA